MLFWHFTIFTFNNLTFWHWPKIMMTFRTYLILAVIEWKDSLSKTLPLWIFLDILFHFLLATSTDFFLTNECTIIITFWKRIIIIFFEQQNWYLKLSSQDKTLKIWKWGCCLLFNGFYYDRHTVRNIEFLDIISDFLTLCSRTWIGSAFCKVLFA